MKLRTTLFAGLLLGATTFTMADEAVDINVLIAQAQELAPADRFEVINEIKAQISTMSADDREVALAQVQASREAMGTMNQGRPDGATRPEGIQGRPEGTEGMTRPADTGALRPEYGRPTGATGRPSSIPEGATRPDGVGGRPAGASRGGRP
jgi:hypothetical protein